MKQQQQKCVSGSLFFTMMSTKRPSVLITHCRPSRPLLRPGDSSVRTSADRELRGPVFGYGATRHSEGCQSPKLGEESELDRMRRGGAVLRHPWTAVGNELSDRSIPLTFPGPGLPDNPPGSSVSAQETRSLNTRKTGFLAGAGTVERNNFLSCHAKCSAASSSPRFDGEDRLPGGTAASSLWPNPHSNPLQIYGS